MGTWRRKNKVLSNSDCSKKQQEETKHVKGYNVEKGTNGWMWECKRGWGGSSAVERGCNLN